MMAHQSSQVRTINSSLQSQPQMHMTSTDFGIDGLRVRNETSCAMNSIPSEAGFGLTASFPSLLQANQACDKRDTFGLSSSSVQIDLDAQVTKETQSISSLQPQTTYGRHPSQQPNASVGQRPPGQWPSSTPQGLTITSQMINPNPVAQDAANNKVNSFGIGTGNMMPPRPHAGDSMITP